MKRHLMLIGLALLLSLVVAAPAMAAPRVGLKAGTFGLPALELGYALGDHLLFTGTAGPILDYGYMFTEGFRCYLTRSGLRPFAAVYITQFYNTHFEEWGFSVAATAGLEVLFRSGFFISAEGGGAYLLFTPPAIWCVNLTLGYQF